METTLIIGLGNPGQNYQHTRHNAGFDTVEILAQKLGVAVNKRKSQALVGEWNHKGRKIVLVKPQTYMNLSGESVRGLLAWYKTELPRMVVVLDDIDLPFGKVRARMSGSAGTHNGLRSIVTCLGREDFPRLRIGVGKPPEGWDLVNWVVGHYVNAEERETAFQAYSQAAEALRVFIDEGAEAFLRSANAGSLS